MLIAIGLLVGYMIYLYNTKWCLRLNKLTHALLLNFAEFDGKWTYSDTNGT